jgi:exodeoxyribonuclease V beta subunit
MNDSAKAPQADQPLDKLEPATLKLSGRHLIEASAGTGKTYNITRLYLRLLLERQLPVQNILVMTFGNAATEELRGRIDRELRNAAARWGQLGQEDDFFEKLEAGVEPKLAQGLLQRALLHLDEASIFTIHSFCKRVLSQHALASDLALDLEMEVDTSEQMLEAVRDWLRGMAQKQDFQLLIEKGWHTPEAFLRKFKAAISSRAELKAAEPKDFHALALKAKLKVRDQLLMHEAAIQERLIHGRKDSGKHQNEWQTLLDWLSNGDLGSPPAQASAFANAGRYPKDAELIEWMKKRLKPFIDLKDSRFLNNLENDIEKTAAYLVVRDGIKDIRARFADAKSRQGVMDFDDLIYRLAERINDPQGEALVHALRTQYPVALVDEFQDTDPQQYAILDRVYPRRRSAGEGKDACALFMIGDPKQAIYSFRNGDIFTYLSARQQADDRWQMDTNWRSVPGMVKGYNRLFRGAAREAPFPPSVFGFGIAYEPVAAAKATQSIFTQLQDPLDCKLPQSRQPGDGTRAALNYVWITPHSEDATVLGAFLHNMANWCCSEIHRLLTDARLVKEGKPEHLQERDIAILVRTSREAAIMQKALQAAGYPSVYLSAHDKVFESDEARQLVLVLQGILGCEEKRPLIAACSSDLLGGDAKLLEKLNSDPDALVEKRMELLALRARWQRDGFIPMMLSMIHDHLHPSPQRHERCLTNYIHLAELLQQASGKLRHPQQLLEWLRGQMTMDTSNSEAELRLESDANLIRIITQHGAKGLEYPVVFVPFANYGKTPLKFGNSYAEHIRYHDPQSGEALEVIGRAPEAVEAAENEVFAEAIRQLYVAVTRAEHRCYICCGPFDNRRDPKASDSQLARTLGVGDWGGSSIEPDEWEQRLTALVSDDPESTALLVETVGDEAPMLRDSTAGDDSKLFADEFKGHIERGWRLNSFSALTRNLGHGRRDLKDHDDDLPVDSTEAAPDPGQLSLRFRLAKGAHAGNLLHDILEHTDFSAPRWEETLHDPLLRFGLLKKEDEPKLQEWLEKCLATQLPPIARQDDVEAGAEAVLCLSNLSWPKTLRETEFYFPLVNTQLPRLAGLLARHRGNASAVELPGQSRLQGMMHGFIDLIFEHEGRFYVADYKSTHLGNRLADYAFDALKRNNEVHFYDLQYLIYSLALHRYLRKRLPDYDPARHLGGVYYLYLRGMAPDSDSGVYHCAIEPALILELDRLFKGEIR